MNTKKPVKPLKSNKLLFALLPACLALAPHAASAMDAATGIADEFESDPDKAIVLSNNDHRIVLKREFFLHAEHYCTVVGSADLKHVKGGGSDNRYEIGLSLDDAVPDFVVRRMVELNDNSGVDDPNFVAVSTTAFFTIPVGDHSVELKAKRVRGPGTARVVDASMTVNCFDSQLSNDVIL